MKAVKTIVATAVIVLALTTVAMAGVQQFGSGTGATGAETVASTQSAQHGDSVTLSAQQFAALLHAVSRTDAQHLAAGTTGHARAHTRSKARTHAHAQARAATHTQPAAQATHHAETHHAATHTGTHHDATHDGGSHSGTHDGDGHGGGCD